MHLTAEQREFFYREHIPWKLAELTSYTTYNDLLRRDLPEQQWKEVLSALSFAHCVAGRLLLEFLGIKYNGTVLIECRASGDSVCVADLGGKLVSIDADLTSEQQEILKTFLHLANKNAHFTEDFRRIMVTGLCGQPERS